MTERLKMWLKGKEEGDDWKNKMGQRGKGVVMTICTCLMRTVDPPVNGVQRWRVAPTQLTEHEMHSLHLNVQIYAWNATANDMNVMEYNMNNKEWIG